jgi:antirestriction protein
MGSTDIRRYPVSLIDAFKKWFTVQPSSEERDILHIYVRCKRCGEVIHGRVDKRNELSPSNGGFVWRKELIGSGYNRCFQRIEVILEFDNQRVVTEQRIYDGEFVSEEDYNAYLMELRKTSRPV